jgi:hypothetical protein
MLTRFCSVVLLLPAIFLMTEQCAIAQQPSLTGKWKGTGIGGTDDVVNVSPDVALELKEHEDGTVTGHWDSRVKIEKGERVTADLAQWEAHDGNWRFCYRCSIQRGGKLLAIEITQTTKEDGKKRL